jgi:zinc transport system ATP-binding protein
MKTKDASIPVIELEHVYVAYHQRLVLEDVSLRVEKGQFVGVIGPNGSGKTTLLKAILGLVRPTRGQVRVFGVPPWELDGGRSRIGYVPQIVDIDSRFPIHVADVVMMGRYRRIGLLRRPGPADREAVRWALAQVGMQALADRQIGELSGGQRQRVFVARALATLRQAQDTAEPELLLLDEPTTGFDVAMTEGLYQLLHQLHRSLDLTLLLVSHDVGVVSQFVDQVACISRRLVAHGRPDEMEGEGLLECMYGPETMLFGHGHVPHIVVDKEHKH